MVQMVLTCPQCEYQSDLLSALRDNDQRAFIARLIKHIPDGKTQLVMRYLAMFKPRKNAQSFKTLNKRLDEILALIESAQVKRAGEVRAAPKALWFSTMEELAINKPESLELPLKSHNYLAQMVWSQCDKAEAMAEARREQARRNQVRDSAANKAGMTHLKNLVDNPTKGNP